MSAINRFLLASHAKGRSAVLIIDEAHHDGAMSMATLHGVIDPAFVVGLTATPYRRAHRPRHPGCSCRP